MKFLYGKWADFLAWFYKLLTGRQIDTYEGLEEDELGRPPDDEESSR